MVVMRATKSGILMMSFKWRFSIVTTSEGHDTRMVIGLAGYEPCPKMGPLAYDMAATATAVAKLAMAWRRTSFKMGSGRWIVRGKFTDAAPERHWRKLRPKVSSRKQTIPTGGRQSWWATAPDCKSSQRSSPPRFHELTDSTPALALRPAQKIFPTSP